MQTKTFLFAPIFLMVILLQACGGGGGSSSPPVTTPPPQDPPPEEPPPEEPPPEAPTLSLQPAFDSLIFEQPVALVQAPADDSRWFVVEQPGVIRVFENNPAVTTTSVFLDISAKVTSGGERGLLGMAFHPDFAANGEVFVSYTGSPAGALTSFVSRYRSTDSGLTLDPASEEILLQVAQDFGNHNGGQVAFGPDRNLYIGFGDGGSGNDPNDRAQDVTNVMGAILRIDPDGDAPYGIPTDNPFAGNARCPQGFGGAPCPEIYAWGFRNPWRWSFDESTGELWLGDVGQNDWEEIDVVQRGLNYGWRIREGAHCNVNINPNCDTTGLTDPFWEYDHSVGASVTGGYVYRGSEIPGLVGHYLFGDFASGRVWGIPADGSAPAIEFLDSDLLISSFAQDATGEIFIVDYSGSLQKIIAAD